MKFQKIVLENSLYNNIYKYRMVFCLFNGLKYLCYYPDLLINSSFSNNSLLEAQKVKLSTIAIINNEYNPLKKFASYIIPGNCGHTR